MKAILMIIFWTMIGYALYNFYGYWGVFGEVLFIVFVNLATWDSQIEKIKRKKLKERMGL